jgi:carbonic anhydrase/acetyltransferase-like protein (isoleucine patch superfamily)
MNAVLMDDAIIGKESIIGALCFVPAKMEISQRSVVVGNPAKVVKTVSDEMLKWKTMGTALYQKLPQECFNTLKEVEPLREIEENRPDPSGNYSTWEEIKNKG